MTEDIMQPGCGRRVQVRAKRRNAWTQAEERTFLEALAETANVSRSAAAVGRTISSVYSHRKRSTEFDIAVRAAIDVGVERLEMLVLDAALNGIDQPIVYQGKEAGRTRMPSERLMIFLLQSHRPQVYGPTGFRPRSRDDGLPAPVANAEEARARILALMAEMDAREAEDGDAVIEVKALRRP